MPRTVFVLLHSSPCSQSNFPPCLQTSEKVWFSPRGKPKQNLPIWIHFLGVYLVKGFEKKSDDDAQAAADQGLRGDLFQIQWGSSDAFARADDPGLCGEVFRYGYGMIAASWELFLFLLFIVVLCSEDFVFQTFTASVLKDSTTEKYGETTNLCQLQFPGQCPSLRSPPQKEDFAPLLDKYTLTCGGNWHDWNCKRDQRGSLWVNIMRSRYIQFGGRRFLILWIPSKCLAFYRILNRSQSLWDEVTPSQHLQVSFSSIIAASTGYLMICLLQHEDPTHFFSTLASRKSCERKVKWIQVQSGTHGYSIFFNSLMLFLLYGITRPEMYLVNLHQITWIVAKASYRDLCSTSWMIIPGILWKSWLNYRWP